MVLDMIRAALVSNEEYYKQYDSAVVPERPASAAFKDAGMTIGADDGDRYVATRSSAETSIVIINNMVNWMSFNFFWELLKL